MKSYQTGIRKAIILHANQTIKNILLGIYGIGHQNFLFKKNEEVNRYESTFWR
jgi:hypothetical protein